MMFQVSRANWILSAADEQRDNYGNFSIVNVWLEHENDLSELQIILGEARSPAGAKYQASLALYARAPNESWHGSMTVPIGGREDNPNSVQFVGHLAKSEFEQVIAALMQNYCPIQIGMRFESDELAVAKKRAATERPPPANEFEIDLSHHLVVPFVDLRIFFPSRQPLLK